MSDMSVDYPLDHRECREKTHKNAWGHRTISSICHHPMLGCLPYLNASGGIDNCNLFPDPKSIVVEKKHARKERRGCSSLRFIMKIPRLVPIAFLQPALFSTWDLNNRTCFSPYETKRYLNSIAPTFARVVVMYEENDTARVSLNLRVCNSFRGSRLRSGKFVQGLGKHSKLNASAVRDGRPTRHVGQNRWRPGFAAPLAQSICFSQPMRFSSSLRSLCPGRLTAVVLEDDLLTPLRRSQFFKSISSTPTSSSIA